MPRDTCADQDDARTAFEFREFVTTRWTVVLLAAAVEAADSREAFGRLYLDYWPVLYSYVRRRGHQPAEAEDITQDFFVALLEKERLRGLTREGGHFRSYLLTALKNHIANNWHRNRAAKRGGGQLPVSLDDQGVESQYQLAAQSLSPEDLFERQWAMNVIALAKRGLEQELNATGKGDLYKLIAPHVWEDPAARPYAVLAAESNVSAGALKVAVHRLRNRFAQRLRLEVERTVDNPEEVQAELAHLIAAAA